MFEITFGLSLDGAICASVATSIGIENLPGFDNLKRICGLRLGSASYRVCLQ